MIRRKITVRSMESNELSELAVEEMMARLKVFRWPRQPTQLCNRGSLTEMMKRSMRDRRT